VGNVGHSIPASESDFVPAAREPVPVPTRSADISRADDFHHMVLRSHVRESRSSAENQKQNPDRKQFPARKWILTAEAEIHAPISVREWFGAAY